MAPLIALLLAEFANPIVPGDWPDPGLIRVGPDYYSVRSTFGWRPGLQIIHSRDLVHWRYIGFGLREHPAIPPGTTREGVWGSDIGYDPASRRFLLYAPIGNRIHAMWAKAAGGPYSPPADLGLKGIDPGFFADTDGRLYLVWDWGRIVELAPGGLAVKGEVCDTRLGRGRDFEGPSLVRRGAYYYCVYSTGGTRPHQTSAIRTARARHLGGPWERDPADPQLQANDDSGAVFQGPAHATLVETQGGEWFVAYHAFQTGYYTLGRSMLLDPVEWTSGGWWRPVNGRIPSVKAPRPRLPEARFEMAESDEFDGPALGLQWFFHDRVEHSLSARPGWLRLGRGSMLQRVTRKAFQFQARVEARGAAGVQLYHDPGMWVRLSAGGLERSTGGRPAVLAPAPGATHVRVRVEDRERATFFASADGRRWRQIGGEVYVGDGGDPDLGWVGFNKRNTWTAATFGVFAEESADFEWFRVSER